MMKAAACQWEPRIVDNFTARRPLAAEGAVIMPYSCNDTHSCMCTLDSVPANAKLRQAVPVPLLPYCSYS
eukprot:scaffold384825_cov39-Prasinocladus_malaysianus.AAC.1